MQTYKTPTFLRLIQLAPLKINSKIAEANSASCIPHKSVMVPKSGENTK